MGGYKFGDSQYHLDVLKLAYDQGIQPPIIIKPKFLDWKPPQVDEETVRKLLREPPPPVRRDKITDQLDEPVRDTRALEYQDSSFFHQKIVAPFVSGRSYELARFQTTYNENGFVRLIWTYAGSLDAGLPTYPDWRDPFGLQRLFPNMYLTWFMRLHNGLFQKEVPAPYAGPTALVSGYGYSNLPEWIDYRFQWGVYSAKVFFLVPAGHALRLYVRIVGAVHPNLAELGGRLAGALQPIDVKPTAYNATHGFN